MLCWRSCRSSRPRGFAGGGRRRPSRRRGAAARPAPSEPLEIALKPAHHSGVTGTATLVPGSADMKVTLTLSKRVQATLLAHVHTGPCSKEPTYSNPRIWANLNDVVDGGSETTVNVVTLKELQSESSSINVHDPTTPTGRWSAATSPAPRSGKEHAMTKKILVTAITAACALALVAGPAQASGRSTIAFNLAPNLAGLSCPAGSVFGFGLDVASLGGQPLGTGRTCVESIAGAAIRSCRSAARRCARRSRSTSRAAR